MLLNILFEAQVSLKSLTPPYSPDIASFCINEFSKDLLTKTMVENPNVFTMEEREAWDIYENLSWEDEVKRFGSGWDTLKFSIDNRNINTPYSKVSIYRGIKPYSKEDENKFWVTLFYEHSFNENFHQRFEYYSEKEDWHQQVHERFLSKVRTIAPVKIETDYHLDFVGLC